MHLLALYVFANRQKGEIVVRAIIFFVYLTNLQNIQLLNFMISFILELCRFKPNWNCNVECLNRRNHEDIYQKFNL